MNHSRYTYRHLDQLGKFSTATPLRVIALIDFDAFYAQCETVRLGLSPATPLAVQQWNAIIALNYPARESGLKRGASVEEARRLCPKVVLQHVATWREGETTWAYRPDFAKHMSIEKSALDPYRVQSRKCFDFIRSMLPDEPMQRVEKASIDEVFLDLSAQVHYILLERFPELAEQPADHDVYLPLPAFSSPLDWETDHVVNLDSVDPRLDWDDIAFNIGAGIVRRIRADIFKHFKYTCSAGIARNKMLAKLGAGFKKPNQQTVIPTQAIGTFLASHKFTKIRGLGGKLGVQLGDSFGYSGVADVVQIPIDELRAKLGDESGCWVYKVVRGRETSIVTRRVVVQSMLSAKTFVPNVESFDQAMKWLRIFAADLMGRLNELQNDFPCRPTIVALHHHINGRFGPTRSKQTTVSSASALDEMILFSCTKELLRQACDDGRAWPCASLSVSISGFEPIVTRNHRITSYFAKGLANTKRARTVRGDHEGPECEAKRIRKTGDEEGLGCEPASRSIPIGTALTMSLECEENAKTTSYDCPKCGKGIQASDVLEHLDWHTALEMQ